MMMELSQSVDEMSNTYATISSIPKKLSYEVNYMRKSRRELYAMTQNKSINPPREAVKSKSFLRDWDKLSQQDIHILEEAMLLLIADAQLPQEWQDHELKGGNDEIRECCVTDDLLLVYQVIRHPVEGITFLRAGTHSEIFGR